MTAVVLDFCSGPLAEDSHRVGMPQLGPELGPHGARRSTYRIIDLIARPAILRRSRPSGEGPLYRNPRLARTHPTPVMILRSCR